MNNQELVNLLVFDLNNEYKHMMFYLRASVEIQGLHREDFKEFFLKEAAEEMNHVAEFSEMITYLGGEPKIDAVFEYKSGQHPTDILIEINRMEQEVADNYTNRMKITSLMENATTAMVNLFYEDQLKHSQMTAWEVLKMLVKI